MCEKWQQQGARGELWRCGSLGRAGRGRLTIRKAMGCTSRGAEGRRQEIQGLWVQRGAARAGRRWVRGSLDGQRAPTRCTWQFIGQQGNGGSQKAAHSGLRRGGGRSWGNSGGRGLGGDVAHPCTVSSAGRGCEHSRWAKWGAGAAYLAPNVPHNIFSPSWQAAGSGQVPI